MRLGSSVLSMLALVASVCAVLIGVALHDFHAAELPFREGDLKALISWPVGVLAVCGLLGFILWRVLKVRSP